MAAVGDRDTSQSQKKRLRTHYLNRLDVKSAMLAAVLDGKSPGAYPEYMTQGKEAKPMEKVQIDVKELYGDVAKLEKLEDYVTIAKELAGSGNDVVLTGQGPVWLYLAVAHALHGRARSLVYDSPVTGPVVIFNHNPF